MRLIINRSNLISFLMIFLSIWAGIRLFDIFLDLNDRELYKISTSKRKLNDGSNLYVSHPIDYDISSSSKDTIIYIGDSFGQGVGCGNKYNITGCLSVIHPDKKVINLSKAGTSPAFYKSQLEKYLRSQRKDKFESKNEQIFISLYSNDIIIDKYSCNYFKLNKSRLIEKFNEKELEKIHNICDSFKNVNEVNTSGINSFRLPFRKQLIKIFGFYSFLFFREIAAQISLEFYEIIGAVNKSNSLGRASYIPKWSNPNSLEFILMSQILNDINNLCKQMNCNLKIVTFPNVENLSTNSKIRTSLNNFGVYMNENFSIKIYDGYKPFIHRGIRNSKYSLTNIHSNCNGYKIYASWIGTLIDSSKI